MRGDRVGVARRDVADDAVRRVAHAPDENPVHAHVGLRREPAHVGSSFTHEASSDESAKHEENQEGERLHGSGLRLFSDLAARAARFAAFLPATKVPFWGTMSPPAGNLVIQNARGRARIAWSARLLPCATLTAS